MAKTKGSGHYFGIFLLVVVALAVFAVSVTLSLTFFQGITPPDKPWFPYFGLSLTEAGFACWLGAFLWVRHHAFHTFVEFTMTCLSFLGIISTAGVELFSLMPGTSIDVKSALVANIVGMLLTIVFLANIISVFVAAIVFYSENNPGWFRGGHSFPENRNFYSVNGGETETPLVLNQGRPKEAPASLYSQSTVEENPQQVYQKPKKNLPPMRNPQETGLLGEGVSSVMQGLRSFTGNIRTAGRVHGRTNESTSENG